MRKLARVGRPRRRSRSSAPYVGQGALQPGRLGQGQRVGGAVAPARVAFACVTCQASGWLTIDEAVDGSGERLHHPRRLLLPECREGGVEPVEQLGEPAGEVDLGAVNVVEREGGADQAEVLLIHRDAGEQAVEPVGPGVLPDADEAVAGTGRVELPADAGAAYPVTDTFQRLLVEAESASHRLHGREVKDLRSGEARVGELQQPGDDIEHRVGLSRCANGRPAGR